MGSAAAPAPWRGARLRLPEPVAPAWPSARPKRAATGSEPCAGGRGITAALVGRGLEKRADYRRTVVGTLRDRALLRRCGVLRRRRGRLERRRGSLGRRHADLQGRLNGRDGSGQPLDRQRSGVIGRGLNDDGHRDRQIGLHDGAVVPRAGNPNRDVDVDRLILRCHRLILRRGLRSAIRIPVCISTAIPIPVPVPDLLEVLRGKHNRGCDHIPAAPRPRPVPGVNRSHRRVGRREQGPRALPVPEKPGSRPRGRDTADPAPDTAAQAAWRLAKAPTPPR